MEGHSSFAWQLQIFHFSSVSSHHFSPGLFLVVQFCPEIHSLLHPTPSLPMSWGFTPFLPFLQDIFCLWCHLQCPEMVLKAEPSSSWFCAADYPDLDALENPSTSSKALRKNPEFFSMNPWAVLGPHFLSLRTLILALPPQRQHQSQGFTRQDPRFQKNPL